MTHKMRLHNRPFLAIKKGKKRVELRLLDEKRSMLNEGGMVEFSNTKTGETLLCRVAKLRVFPNFEKLYVAYSPIEIGYEENQVADPKDMLQYYTQEEIDRYGVVAIELQLTE